jgi:hypothetical protein
MYVGTYEGSSSLRWNTLRSSSEIEGPNCGGAEFRDIILHRRWYGHEKAGNDLIRDFGERYVRRWVNKPISGWNTTMAKESTCLGYLKLDLREEFVQNLPFSVCSSSFIHQDFSRPVITDDSISGHDSFRTALPLSVLRRANNTKLCSQNRSQKRNPSCLRCPSYALFMGPGYSVFYIYR